MFHTLDYYIFPFPGLRYFFFGNSKGLAVVPYTFPVQYEGVLSGQVRAGG